MANWRSFSVEDENKNKQFISWIHFVRTEEGIHIQIDGIFQFEDIW